jgi:ankyrin repeat protein
MRSLPPSVQAWIFQAFDERRLRDQEKKMLNPPEYFLLAACCINGYGIPVNNEVARNLIDMASREKHEPSQNYAFRIWDALGPGTEIVEGMKNHMEMMAYKGSRTALEDLVRVSPEKGAEVKEMMKKSTMGQGSDVFFRNKMLHNLFHWAWEDMLRSRDSIAEKLSRVKDKAKFPVNRRGDRIIHIAAASGWAEAVEALVDTYSVDANMLNDSGETPLLMACRSGHPNTVRTLVSLGADASICTPRGESALHWLVSFEPEDVEEMGNFLVGSGASTTAYTTENISYSVLKASIEVDRQAPGTPMIWAVHNNRPDIVEFLLSASDDLAIHSNSIKHDGSALGWAAHYHHHECLKLICDALLSSGVSFNFGQLVTTTLWSADAFSMILRHGRYYKENLHRTIDLYVEYCSNVSLRHSMGANGVVGSHNFTPLYHAITRMSDLAVEYLLSPEVTTKVEFIEPGNGIFHSDHINLACGPDARTPLLESVRFNRAHIFSLLLKNGADPYAVGFNPFVPSQKNWTAMHVLAHAAHNPAKAPRLLDEFLELGIPIDGRTSDAIEPETPLGVALGACALNLATHFIAKGADINATSMNSGLITSSTATTILGHTAASTSRSALPRLRWLLNRETNKVDFIVEKERKLTALHRAAMANHGMRFAHVVNARRGLEAKIEIMDPSSERNVLLPLASKDSKLGRADMDWETNRTVVTELLEHFHSAEEVIARCSLGRTALHWAVVVGNVAAVDLLLQWHERRHKAAASDKSALAVGLLSLKDSNDEDAAAIAKRLVDSGDRKEKATRQEILGLLSNQVGHEQRTLDG